MPSAGDFESVTWRDMVLYVKEQEAATATQFAKLENTTAAQFDALRTQLNTHEQTHQKQLEAQLAGLQAARRVFWTTGLSAISALTAVLALILH